MYFVFDPNFPRIKESTHTYSTKAKELKDCGLLTGRQIQANLFLFYKAIALSPWMTSAQILPAQIPPRPMDSRNPVAGDAPESNFSENEVSTESLSAFPSGLCVWIFGDARGHIRVSFGEANGNPSRIKGKLPWRCYKVGS